MIEEDTKQEYAKKVRDMILFLEKTVNSDVDFYINDPLDLGESFIKIGVYVVRTNMTKKEFMTAMEYLWDDVTEFVTFDEDEEELPEGAQVLFDLSKKS